MIQQYRKEKGEPPEKMMFVYEYLHEKQMAIAKEVKVLQEMYKE